MSDRVVQSINHTNARSTQTMPSYNSVWMAHWMQTSCNPAEETCNNNASGNKELDYATKDDDLTNGLEVSRQVKGLRLIETNKIAIVDGCPKMSSKGIGNGRVQSSLLKYGQDSDGMQTSGPVFGHSLERGKATDCKSGTQCSSLIPGVPASNKMSSEGCHSLGEGTSKNPLKWMKTCSPGKGSSSAMPSLLQETLVESSRHIVPCSLDFEKYKFDKGKSAASPLISRSPIVSKQLLNANLRMQEHEHCHEHNQSADLVCERKLECHSLGTCDRYLLTLGEGWFPKMKKCSGIRPFPSQCIASGKTETKVSHNDCYSPQNLQNRVHDLETMKICTTVDSAEGTSGGIPRFSQTTHCPLIMKKTCVNLLKENDIFRSTRVTTKISRNTSSDLHHLSPFFGQGEQGVKIEPVTGPVDSKAKENAGHVKNSKVTDTMDIDSSKEKNLHSGEHSTTSTEVFNMDCELPHGVDVASSREAECQQADIELPDINLELPALPGERSSSAQMSPSSSKTRSLVMNMLLGHVEQTPPKSNFSLDDCPNADPGNRWVKRLKLSSSYSSAQGTKISNLAENTSHKNTSRFLGRMLKSSIARATRKHHGEEPKLPSKSGNFIKKDEEYMGKGLLLSNAWIERWLRNGSRITEKKPQTTLVCESEGSKLAPDSLQKEQFPSIAAMALMGKSMIGLQQFELKKRGSFTVWNTNAL